MFRAISSRLGNCAWQNARFVSTYKKAEPVTVALKDIQPGGAGLDLRTLEKAFGKDSLGIMLVSGLPAEYAKLRRKVLTQASFLSELPEKSLGELESPEGHYLVGWSRGKESLASGLPDTNKGSYYINCSFHKDPALEGPPAEDCKGFEEYKAYTTWNKWPNEAELKGLKKFEQNCKGLISIMIGAGSQLAKFCDAYCQIKHMTLREKSIPQMINESTTSKARLLHYYPLSEEEAAKAGAVDSWCGEHNDHSILTGLTSAMFLDETNMEVDMDDDPDCGLFIKDRHGDRVKVEIPEDCLAFQTGQALEELSNGSFKAVPHYVRGPSKSDVCRNTLAVFLQPSLHDKVNAKENFAEFAERILSQNHA